MKENITHDELQFAETIFSRDIETRVIQVIILQCLSKVEGVALTGGNIIDSIFNREGERVKGIVVEQDVKNHFVNVKVEVSVAYGISIPKKAEEVQTKIVEEITSFTGLHVASVHVIVKNILLEKDKKDLQNDIDSDLIIQESEDQDETIIVE